MTMWSDNRNHLLDDVLTSLALSVVAVLVGVGPGQFVALVALGWYFGNLPWVKKNLSLVIVAIIAISLLPMLWAFVRQRFFPRAGTAKDE